MPAILLAPRDQTVTISDAGSNGINAYCSGGVLSTTLNLNINNPASATISTQFSVNGVNTALKGFTNAPYNPSEGPGSTIANGLWVFQPSSSTSGCTVNIGACVASDPVPSVKIAFSAALNGSPVTVVNSLSSNNGGTFNNPSPPGPNPQSDSPVATTPPPQPQNPTTPAPPQQDLTTSSPPDSTAPQNGGGSTNGQNVTTLPQFNSTNGSPVSFAPQNGSDNPISATSSIGNTTTNTSTMDSSSSNAIVVGAVIGVICVVAVVLGIVWYIRAWKKRHDDEAPVPGFLKPGTPESLTRLVSSEKNARPASPASSITSKSKFPAPSSAIKALERQLTADVNPLPPAPQEQLPAGPNISPKPARRVPMTAVNDFEPQQDDELEVRVGQLVYVEQSFEDGWGYGINTHFAGKKGYFPLWALDGGAANASTKNPRRESLFFHGSKNGQTASP